MTNSLLPFDPLKAKNGDVVIYIFEPRDNDVTFVGMYNGIEIEVPETTLGVDAEG